MNGNMMEVQEPENEEGAALSVNADERHVMPNAAAGTIQQEERIDPRYAMTGLQRTGMDRQLIKPTESATKMFLSRFAGNMMNSVASRKFADRNLSALDAMSESRENRANRENVASLMMEAERAKAQTALQGRLAMADAQVQGRKITAESNKEINEGKNATAVIVAENKNAISNRKMDLQEWQALDNAKKREYALDLKRRALDAEESGKWSGELPPINSQLVGDDGTVSTYRGKRGKFGQPIWEGPPAPNMWTPDPKNKTAVSTDPAPTAAAQPGKPVSGRLFSAARQQFYTRDATGNVIWES